jgi:superfamily II DNA helicase RecQ
MDLQIKFFSVPVGYESDVEQDMNQFLRHHKIVNIRKEFVCQSDQICWCYAVEYLSDSQKDDTSANDKKKKKDDKPKIDYAEVLSPDDFAIYAKMRTWRKELADKKGEYAFTILTNAQMAQIAEKKIHTLQDLEKVSGIGEQKINQYGHAIVDLMKSIIKEKNIDVSPKRTQAKLLPDNDDQKKGIKEKKSC